MRRPVKILLDFCCGASAVLLTLALGDAFAGFDPGDILRIAAGVGLLLVTSLAIGGSYRTMWRYTTLREMTFVASSAAVVALGLLAWRALDRLEMSSADILLITLLTLFNCLALRALPRWHLSLPWRRHQRSIETSPTASRVLIVGAGLHGLSIGREIAQRRGHGVELVGYLDDNPAKIGARLNGAPVLGPLSEALVVCETYRVSEVIVAMPSADSTFIRASVRRLEDSGVRVHAVHGVQRFVTGDEMHRPGSATLLDLIAEIPGSGAPAEVEAGTASAGSGGAAGVAGGIAPRRRVLVTGGAGYIGAHLVRQLLERGYAVRVLDRFDYGRHGLDGLQHPDLEIVQGDICNSRDLSRALKRVDGVVALAAIVGDPACNLDPEETINLNYTATKILAETCSLYGVRRLVFASSCSVYGANNQTMLTERSPLNPVSLYARTRVLSENILFDRHGDVEPVVMRLATVFGLSPRPRFDLVVNTLTVRAVVDGRISIFGGNQYRPNVHGRDVARAFILALEAPAHDVAGQIFNLGGDAQNHRISEIGEMVARLVGDVEVEILGDSLDPRDYRVNFAKIRRVLGFEPESSVADGIREIAAAVRASSALQRWQDPMYHNVQALKQTLVAPRRRSDDTRVRQLARA